MPKPLTREQRAQNRAFLNALRRTGNVRLAARDAAAKYGTMQHRRKQHPAFAVQWDAALAFAQARLNGVGRNPLSPTPLPQRGEGLRTVGGEAVVVRLKDGTVQVRRAQPGKLTRACEQAFLAALSATANVTLSAAAAGASPRAFYRRKRHCPAFSREMRMALKMGYDRLEEALLESSLPQAHEHDEWRHNDPPAIPPMSVNQALQLMYLHQKEARLVAEPFLTKRRRGEPHELYLLRLAEVWKEQERQALEEFEVAEAERWAQGLPAWGPAGEDVRAKLGLPDLAQVTGWSRADPAKVPHDRDAQSCWGHGEHRDDRALFGGWRIEDMEEKLEREAWRIEFKPKRLRLRLPRVRRL